MNSTPSHAECFRAYLKHDADMSINSISAMLTDDVTLHDWNVAVVGETAVPEETSRNFDLVKSVLIQVLHLHESRNAVAGDLSITLDDRTELCVVDVMTFNADGHIRSIRAYLGRGDASPAKGLG